MDNSVIILLSKMSDLDAFLIHECQSPMLRLRYQRKENEMSLLTCSACGIWAEDNTVTWYSEFDPARGDVIDLCEQCEEALDAGDLWPR